MDATLPGATDASAGESPAPGAARAPAPPPPGVARALRCAQEPPTRHSPREHPMSFTDAVQKCLSSYVTFNGRARRSEYW